MVAASGKTAWWKKRNKDEIVAYAAWGFYTAALRGEVQSELNLNSIASYLLRAGVYSGDDVKLRMKKVTELARDVYELLEKLGRRR